MKFAYVALMLASCSSSSGITLPSGRAGFVVDCSGTASSIARCYEAAGKSCPTGFTIIDVQQERGVLTVPQFEGRAQNFATATRSMLIQCKA